MGGSALRMRAVVAYPSITGKSGKAQRIVESANPVLRSRTPNVSIVLATTHVLNRRSASSCAAAKGSAVAVMKTSHLAKCRNSSPSDRTEKALTEWDEN